MPDHMKRPAVFFDRDNTLIVSDGYLGDPAKVQLIPGAAAAVARARRLGYAVVVFSNQSGVARGMFSEEDVQAVNARMEQMLAAEDAGAVIDRHEFCPFHPEGTVDVYARESDRRKPGPGMILSAARALELELGRSWVIGDAGRDIEAGKAAGCRTVLFVDAGLKKSPAAEARRSVEPDYTAGTLSEAMDYVEHGRSLAATTTPAVAAASVPAAAVAETAVAPTTTATTTAPAATTTAEAPRAAAAVAETASAPPANGAAAKRVPKVVIGSKYVPPEGKEGSRATGALPPPTTTPVREEPGERPAWKPAQRSVPATPAAGTGAENELPPRALEPPPATPYERMESLLEQIFLELRRQHEHQDGDFSVSKLLAGVVQVIALAVVIMAYFKRPDWVGVQLYLMLAMVLQTLTISLLIMTRQR
jgi:histidinol-phosphate phosphatase family protein